VRALLFLHIHKTGGSTLTGALSNRFAARDCLSLYFGPEPDLGDLERFRFISGHLDISFLAGFREPPFVVTFLRDPIERALSSFSYTRSFPPDYQPPVLIHGRGPEAYERYQAYRRLARECSILELIERAPEVAVEYLGNRQARVLGGTSPDGGDERLDRALEGLERCDFVGISERLEESLAWLTRRLGWRDLGPLPRTNVTTARVRREQVASETMEALLELTEIDRQLYRMALDRRRAGGDPRVRSARIPDAPAVSDLRFSKAIPGGGWLGRESLGDRPCFSWIGSTRSAWVELAVDRRADSLVVEIPHVLDQQILESLRISVNERPARHQLAGSNGIVIARARLERHHLPRRGTVRVGLEVERTTRPCDVDPNSPDDRRLSIAVSSIALARS
jgi:hypothetical protein